MDNLFFLSDDATGKLAIVRIPQQNVERQIALRAAAYGMADPDSNNLTWGGVSSIGINI